MPKRSTLLRIPGFLAAVACTCATLALAAQVTPATREEPEAPGRIVLDAAPEGAAGQLPPVVFDHDLHTGSEAPDATCATCHDARDAKSGYPLRGTAGKTGSALENAFHDTCFSCHEATREKDLPAGPQKAECRSCHEADTLPSSAKKTGPDKTAADGGLSAALHARHIASGLIPSGADGANCAACHHPVEKPLSPALQEDSCRSCHTPKKAGDRPSGIPPFAEAAHAACISCHRTIAASGKTALPVTCESCHSASVKEGYEKPAPPPRLRAGQPDAILMGGPGALPDAATPPEPAMPPVVFNHTLHEAQTANCVSCHHNTMRQCSSCHTPTGSPDGNTLTLSEAMHRPDSERSCVGCHETRKTASPECAGCHAILPKAKDAQPVCESCHQPVAAHKSFPSRPLPAQGRMDAAIEAAPENVTVGVLAKEYDPAVFPHRAIIRNLSNGIRNSSPGMARFHAGPYALCASCHHNSPPSAAPPACASCHAPAASLKDSRPPLKEAYHRQCMTCHTAMNITTPANTDCASCHTGRVAGREGGR